MKMTQAALASKQDVCQDTLTDGNVEETSDQFVIASTLLTSPSHFVSTLCMLDEKKAMQLAKISSIQTVVFKDFSVIDANIIDKLSILLAHTTAGVAFDLTGAIMTDYIKELTGRMLLDSDHYGAGLISVQTDLFALSLASPVGCVDLTSRHVLPADAAHWLVALNSSM